MSCKEVELQETFKKGYKKIKSLKRIASVELLNERVPSIMLKGAPTMKLFKGSRLIPSCSPLIAAARNREAATAAGGTRRFPSIDSPIIGKR
jgi:hypothetical protein